MQYLKTQLPPGRRRGLSCGRSQIKKAIRPLQCCYRKSINRCVLKRRSFWHLLGCSIHRAERGKHPQDLHLRRCPQTSARKAAVQGELAGRARGAPRGGSPAPGALPDGACTVLVCPLTAWSTVPASSPGTRTEINPSNTKARRTEPQLLLKSMRLFTVPVSRDFHSFE